MQNCAAPGTAANAPYALPIPSFPFLQSEDESRLSSHACMYTHIAQHSKPRKSSASLHLSTRYEIISSGGDDSGGGGGGGGSDSQANFSSAARSLHRNQHQHPHYRQRRHEAEAADSKKVTAATTRVFTQHFSIHYVLFCIFFSVGIFSLTDVCQYINTSSTGLTESKTTTVG
ncbi:unnamed protein product [Taenia asiatica]|uniref:Pecanex-like protein n=1 Tax=Taenia asiatica TaxID=60517 RepID=A0A0R3WGY6_TAEAS|nr:unnamed protein product [Taenia asiatica]